MRGRSLQPALVAVVTGVFSQFGPAVAQDYHADRSYDPQAMDEARAALRHETGGQRQFVFRADRLEYRVTDGQASAVWSLNAWYGGQVNRLWLKSETEFAFDGDGFEEARLEAMYSRAVTPFFDVQVGLAQDFQSGRDRTHAVVGVQGVAPYWFEIGVAAYLSETGNLTATFEAEYEFLLTQRLILQPRAELGWASQDAPSMMTGAGLTAVQAGARLRYEFTRQFAPYLGVEWSRELGDTAAYARAAGSGEESTALVVGLRLGF